MLIFIKMQIKMYKVNIMTFFDFSINFKWQTLMTINGAREILIIFEDLMFGGFDYTTSSNLIHLKFFLIKIYSIISN